jgi:hypothetical protein
MTKNELLAKIKEICPSALIVRADDGSEELCIATGLVEPGEGEDLVVVADYNFEPSEEEGQGFHYFAEDGNYGSSTNLVILETSKWNDDDWEEIDDTQTGTVQELQKSSASTRSTRRTKENKCHYLRQSCQPMVRYKLYRSSTNS